MSMIMRQGFTQNGSTIGDLTIITDSGTATSMDNELFILGSHNTHTTASGNTITVATKNTHTLGDISSLGVLTNALNVQTGDVAILAGNLNMINPRSGAGGGVIFQSGSPLLYQFLGTGSGSLTNTFFGTNVGHFDIGTAGQNLGIGSDILGSLTNVPGNNNTAIGRNIGNNIQTGASNTLIGRDIGNSITGGRWITAVGTNTLPTNVSERNTAIGLNAGSALVGSNTGNLYINNVGVSGESSTIRIGTQGSGVNQQNRTFIAGIRGATPTGTLQNVIINSAGQLGTGTAGPNPSVQSAFTAQLAADETTITADGNEFVVGSQSGYTVTNNRGSDFTGTDYIAPFDGLYYFHGYTQVSGTLSDNFLGELLFSDTLGNYRVFNNFNLVALKNSAGSATMRAAAILVLDQGDLVQLRTRLDGLDTYSMLAASGGEIQTRFEGQLLHTI
jgi:hypothetical protein